METSATSPPEFPVGPSKHACLGKGLTTRYAIYFAPEAGSHLADFGARTLGYDAASGEVVPFWAGLPVAADTWSEWTQSPRRYGFHATLKAPFVLKQGTNEGKLIGDLRRFAASRGGIDFGIRVGVVGGFVALVPASDAAHLNALAADCVTRFDAFRAPPTPKERARRLARPLSERQRDHLERWGYPYVLEEFRFHMTLTDSLSPEQQAIAHAFLAECFAASCQMGATLCGLSLFRQDDEASRFRIVEQVPFAF